MLLLISLLILLLNVTSYLGYYSISDFVSYLTYFFSAFHFLFLLANCWAYTPIPLSKVLFSSKIELFFTFQQSNWAYTKIFLLQVLKSVPASTWEESISL